MRVRDFLPAPRPSLKAALLAGGVVAAAAAPAAAELDAQGLQADFQATIDSYIAASGGAIQAAGPATAATEGGTVVLTAPALAFTPGPDTRVDVPPIQIRLDEIDADRIGFAVTLPSEITGVNASGPQPDNLLITLGAQEINGVYRPSLQGFERFYLRIDGFNGSVDDGAVSLGGIAFGLDAEEMQQGRWRGAQSFKLSDLSVADGAGAKIIGIGVIESEALIENIDWPAYAEISQRMSGGNPLHGMPAPDPKAAQAAMLELVQRLPDLLDGGSGRMTFAMANLDVAQSDTPAFKLGQAALALDLAPDEALYSFGLNLAVEDPTVDPSQLPAPPSLVPNRFVSDVALRKLPIQAVWQMVSEPLQAHLESDMSAESEKQLDAAMEMAPFAAMGMAAEAGSFAELKTVELEVGRPS